MLKKFKVYRKYWFWNKFLLYCDNIQEKEGILFFLDDKEAIIALMNKSQFSYAIFV